MTLSYSAAELADIFVIYTQAKNLIDTYEVVASIDYEKVLAWVERKLTEKITDYTCVKLDNEKCAWYCLCEDGELDDLYVLPDFQNRGIGSEILKKCIKESEKTSICMYFPAIPGQFLFMRSLAFLYGKPWGRHALSCLEMVDTFCFQEYN